MSFFSRKSQLVEPDQALPGREADPFRRTDKHVVLDAPVVTDDVPDGLEVAIFGLGCFWGAEEIYWKTPGVWSTSVGYAGRADPAPLLTRRCAADAPATPRRSASSSTPTASRSPTW